MSWLKRGDTLVMKKIIFLLSIFFNLFAFQVVYAEENTSNEFVFMIVPDTQFMVMPFSYQGSSYAQFTAQTSFIKDQKDILNIKFISHVGDVVDHSDDPFEWSQFKKGWADIKSSAIPWAIAPGNHDTNLPMGSGGWETYNQEFPASEFLAKAWAVETFPEGSNQNNLSFFNVSTLEFMVLSIGYNMSPAEYEWATSKLKQYSNKRAIISTHDVNNGQFKKLAQENDNVFLIVSGHYTAPEWHNTFENGGGTVHEIMADYQGGLNGYLRYYIFKPSLNQIEAVTYSPHDNTYRTGESANFSFDYLMTETKIPFAKFTVQSNALKVACDASKSFDTDGTIKSYVWNFGDNSENSEGVAATHTYPGTGQYTITLTVTDNDGNSDIEIKKVNVRASTKIPAKIEAEDYHSMSGIETSSTTDIGGGLSIGWFDIGDWVDYSINVKKASKYTFEYRIANGSETEKNFELLENEKVIDTITVPATGGWQNWQTISSTVKLKSGENTYRLNLLSSGINFNWINIDYYVPEITSPTNLNGFLFFKRHLLLYWSDNSDNETGFNIYYSTDNTKPETANITVTTDTQCVFIPKLSANTSYNFWIEAVNENSKSETAKFSITTGKKAQMIFKDILY